MNTQEALAHDVFRRLEDDAVLGLMDMKGMEQPFMFVLRRQVEAATHTHQPAGGSSPTQSFSVSGTSTSPRTVPSSESYASRPWSW
jgi:hypothetical protein